MHLSVSPVVVRRAVLVGGRDVDLLPGCHGGGGFGGDRGAPGGDHLRGPLPVLGRGLVRQGPVAVAPPSQPALQRHAWFSKGKTPRLCELAAPVKSEIQCV